MQLTDFGISKMKHATYLSRNALVGTPAYTAPEVYRCEPVRCAHHTYACPYHLSASRSPVARCYVTLSLLTAQNWHRSL